MDRSISTHSISIKSGRSEPGTSTVIRCWTVAASSVIGATLASGVAQAQIVSQSVLGHPPERVTLDSNHVETTSGTIALPGIIELSLGAGLYGLTLSHAYSSVSGLNESLAGMMDVQTFGPQWMYAIVLASWGGQSWTFDPSDNGSARTRDGTGIQGSNVTLRDGTVIVYTQISNPPGCGGLELTCHSFFYPTQVTYPNGLVITPHYSVYPGAPPQVRIQSVTSNAGYQIKYVYQSNDTSHGSSGWGTWLARTTAIAINNAVEYCDPDADTCSLSGSWPYVTYSDLPGTYTLTDVRGNQTRYTYSSTYFGVKTAGSTSDNYQYTLASYTDPDTAQPAWHVTGATSVSAAGTSTWSYSYGGSWPTRTITASDPLSHASVFTSSLATMGAQENTTYQIRKVDSMSDPLTRTTSFAYPCLGSTSLYNVTATEGNAESITCDVRGNVTGRTQQAKPGSGLANISTSAHFPDCTAATLTICNQPDYTIDGRAHRTDYTYDATHGGVLTETWPAVTVPGVTGSVRPQRRYSYAQYYAYAKNASGSMVAAATPVWLPTQVSECRTSASCTGGSDEVVTTYEYAATGTVNRLLVRGRVVTSGGVSLRTCYAYDSIGNQISVTTPRAGLSACP
jgi:hypothetical protein